MSAGEICLYVNQKSANNFELFKEWMIEETCVYILQSSHSLALFMSWTKINDAETLAKDVKVPVAHVLHATHASCLATILYRLWLLAGTKPYHQRAMSHNVK